MEAHEPVTPTPEAPMYRNILVPLAENTPYRWPWN